VLQHHALRLRDVRIDVADRLSRKRCAENIEIGLIIQTKEAIVKNGGADAGPLKA
jgi:hypothetical protein